MLSLTVKIGEAIAIGNSAVIKVVDKSGQRVRLVVATRRTNPVKILNPGIIPPKFTFGITAKQMVTGNTDRQMLLPFA